MRRHHNLLSRVGIFPAPKARDSLLLGIECQPGLSINRVCWQLGRGRLSAIYHQGVVHQSTTLRYPRVYSRTDIADDNTCQRLVNSTFPKLKMQIICHRVESRLLLRICRGKFWRWLGYCGKRTKLTPYSYSAGIDTWRTWGVRLIEIDTPNDNMQEEESPQILSSWLVHSHINGQIVLFHNTLYAFSHGDWHTQFFFFSILCSASHSIWIPRGTCRTTYVTTILGQLPRS